VSDHTIYQLIGGDATIERLVEQFYARVEADPVLRSMFPAELAPGKRHQYLFIRQYFGGPSEYAEQRGHPRLRMRHAPFAIGQRERDAWLGHMLAAIDDVGIAEPARSAMRDYFARAATHMINHSDPMPGRIALDGA